jgi:pilus assembly protein Flp/PilA
VACSLAKGQRRPPRFTDYLACAPYQLGMLNKFRAFLGDETAATAIEYGLIAAGISIAIISIVKGVGTKLNGTFSSLSSQLK